MDKKELRKISLKKRMLITERSNKEKIIYTKLWPIIKDAKSVAFYMPIKGEVDLTELIDYCLKNSIKVFLPKISGQKMIFKQILSRCDLELGTYNILEPRNINNNSETPEIVIVPLLAFNKLRYRLGYGKGYYDRFLTSYSCISVGVAFSEQLVDNLPYEKHDYQLDLIITDQANY